MHPLYTHNAHEYIVRIHTHMRYAIIAAGEGSRLKEEGISTPKPLVMVNGERLIDRLIRIFMERQASEIVVICNDLYPEVAEHLRELQEEGVPLKYVVKTTESSMHSLHEIAPMLSGEDFILTTVDTYFDEMEFKNFVQAFQETDADGLMGVTDFCDDEKPLYVETKATVDETDLRTITAFLDKTDNITYVSAGIYGLRDNSLGTLEKCISEGQSRMRNFQRALLTDGLKLLAYPIGKVLDIDHKEDIDLVQKKVLGIYRAERFSPGSVEKDKAILDSALSEIRNNGYATSAIREEELTSTDNLPEADLYLSMARGEDALRLLQDKPCMNSTDAIRLCNHRAYIADVATEPPLWVKRTDQCREQEGDVVFCKDREEMQEAIRALEKRGITQYVCQKHYEGEHVKFYGIDPHSPIGLKVYGGDAIIGDDGIPHIIDLNDFPSFSPCRKEAALAIKELITGNLKNW